MKVLTIDEFSEMMTDLEETKKVVTNTRAEYDRVSERLASATAVNDEAIRVNDILLKKKKPLRLG